MSTPPDARIGTTLQGRYRILEAIAAGGMGVVYRGERTQLNRPVAIKFLHAWTASQDHSLKRFEIEARAMSRLSHPNCVSVIDFGTEDGVPYLVMDYVTGRTLRQLLDDGPLPVAQTMQIARQLLAGLAHAHGEGIVHRDIKPDNVLLSQVVGVGMQVRILDFGVAKLRDLGTGELTSGFAVGTPSYMSPEQAGGGSVDARSDVYTTGVLLFEMLTGKKPFVAEEMVEVIRMHREQRAPLIRAVAPGLGLSAALEAVVDKALAKAPEDRYPSAAELARALDATPEGGQPAPRPAARRIPTLVLVPVIAAVLAGGAVAIWLGVRGGKRAGSAAATAPSADANDDAIVIDPAESVAGGKSEDLPGLDEIKEDLRAGRTGPAVAALKKLRKQHPDSAYVPYLLGTIYLQQNLVDAGFDAYRDAMAKDESYRHDPVLIRSCVRILVVSDQRNAGRAMRFVTDEIGAPAIPYLEEARSSKNPAVRERVNSALAKLSSPR